MLMVVAMHAFLQAGAGGTDSSGRGIVAGT
jgi:hypothetical protein